MATCGQLVQQWVITKVDKLQHSCFSGNIKDKEVLKLFRAFFMLRVFHYWHQKQPKLGIFEGTNIATFDCFWPLLLTRLNFYGSKWLTGSRVEG